MKAYGVFTGLTLLACYTAEAFMYTTGLLCRGLLPQTQLHASRRSAPPKRTSPTAMKPKAPQQKETSYQVFDSEGAYEWADYKEKEKARQMELTMQDLMYCFEYGECPVPDDLFTKPWNQKEYKATNQEETYTVFSTDRSFEERVHWAQRWHSDNGESDMEAADYMNRKDLDYDI